MGTSAWLTVKPNTSIWPHRQVTGQIPLKVKSCPRTAAESADHWPGRSGGMERLSGRLRAGSLTEVRLGAGLGCPLSYPHPHLGPPVLHPPPTPQAPRGPGLAAAAALSALGSTRAGPRAAVEGERRPQGRGFCCCGESAIRGAGHRSLFVCFEVESVSSFSMSPFLSDYLFPLTSPSF